MFGHDDDDNHKPAAHDPQPDGVLDDSTPPPPPPKHDKLPFEPPKKHDKPSTDASGPAINDDLLLIKQQALQQLSPLVDQLNQTPEEKFRTTMMMIQASDDEKLIKAAFEAAKSIKDDKVRAQALLDVINEINYFTQPPEDD